MSLLGHFELAAQPFGVTPDPRFIYASASHREALACLLHGIASDRGFTALIAEPGMGKTTLLFHLLQTLKGKATTAFLFQTLCNPQEFLTALLADLGIDDDGSSISSMQSKLNEHLLETSREGRPVVVIVDEAQNLDEGVLEVVRMLSNFETSSRKLMHVVLAGQPQLAKKLATDCLAQLRQRISIVARLNRLEAEETRQYIEHRLRVAGRRSSSRALFNEEAYATIAEHSQGIPRNINNLCFNSMSLACAIKKQVIDGAMVEEAVRDLDLATILPPSVSAQKNAGEESRGRLVLDLFPLWSVTWRRAALFALALVPLVCLGFVTGKALGERRAEALFERTATSAAIPASSMSTPAGPPAAPSPGFKNANETSQPASAETFGITQTLPTKRRIRTRRVQHPAALRSVSPARWNAKFSSPLQPPRITSVARTEPGSPELQPAAQQVSVPSSAQGGKP